MAIQLKRALVIALGNPLSAEDSFGPRVLEAIRARTPDLRGTDLVDAHTDLLGHIDVFSAYSLVIILDTLLDPDGRMGAPGQVLVVEEATITSWPDQSPGIHQMAPPFALKLFRLLHPDAATQVMMVAFSVRQVTFDPSASLPEGVIARAADEVLRLV